jgi:nitroreductase
MDVLEAIKSRRSVREFTDEKIGDEAIEKILDAGRWAPSGLNNQPWRFKVLKGKEKYALAECTKYGHIIKGAPVLIAVFLDENESYDRTKDIQAVGACIQNMLLSAHSQGVGAVWLGEILSQRIEAEKILQAPESCELMAVLALGRPKKSKIVSSRKTLEKLML